VKTLGAILRGWLLGPAAGLGVAFAVAHLLLAVGAIAPNP
jgi:hypothetical protein